MLFMLLPLRWQILAREGYHRSALIKYTTCCLFASAIHTAPVVEHHTSASTGTATSQDRKDTEYKGIAIKIDILTLYMSALMNISICATQLKETAPPLYNTATSAKPPLYNTATSENPPLYNACTYWIDITLTDIICHIYDQPWVYYDLASDVALALPSYYHVFGTAHTTTATNMSNNDSNNDNHSNSNRNDVMSEEDTELLTSLNRLVISVKKAYTLERLHL